MFQAKYQRHFRDFSDIFRLCSSEILHSMGQSLTSYRGNVRLPRQNIVAISPKYPFQAMRNVGEISAIFRENKEQNSFALLLHSTVWFLEHLVELYIPSWLRHRTKVESNPRRARRYCARYFFVTKRAIVILGFSNDD